MGSSVFGASCLSQGFCRTGGSTLPSSVVNTVRILTRWQTAGSTGTVPIRAEYFSEYWEMAAVVALEGTVGNGTHKPAREQLKIMARFIAQNVEFGVTLEGEDK
ncbi:hypothetical protein QAD02_005737 [Eretmocerus hayati]|uniref:Uncharacterized protein n=1 Tax=Eretmocerus hayati TaxID=131215 RepID=A0ACC2NY62_9HYME|nr:hypothetical protein QAD02_005737 [Eretmocerus hayati]